MMKTKVFYIGNNSKWVKELEYSLYTVNHEHKLQIKQINRVESVEMLIKEDPKLIIVDFLSFTTNYYSIFTKYKSLYPENKKILIGLLPEMNHSKISDSLKSGMNFIYPHSREQDELFFVATSIFNILEQDISNSKFAVIQENGNHKVIINEKISDFSFKNTTIETNYKINFDDKIKIKSSLLRKMNFDSYLIPLKELHFNYDQLKKYTIQFENIFLTPEEIEKIKEDTKKEYSDKNVINRNIKELTSENILKKVSEKKHKYLRWKKHYQNYYKFTTKENIIVLGNSNYDIKLNNSKLNEKFNLINKCKLDHTDTVILQKSFPKYFFIEIDNMNFKQEYANNVTFNGELFENNSIKTMLFILENLKTSQKKKCNFILLNKTDTPDFLIKKWLKNYVNSVNIYHINLSSKNIESIIFEFEEKENEINKSVEKCSNRFFNKNDVLKTKKSGDSPIYFEKKEEINDINLEIPININLMSENKIIINTKHELPKYRPILIKHPIIDFYISIVDNCEFDKDNHRNNIKKYKAIIHGLNRKSRDALRGYIINHKKQYKMAI